MRIEQAISEARRKNKRISSVALGMHAQSAKNLIYWIFEHTEHPTNRRLGMCIRMMAATDWKLDE